MNAKNAINPTNPKNSINSFFDAGETRPEKGESGRVVNCQPAVVQIDVMPFDALGTCFDVGPKGSALSTNGKIT